MSARAIIVSIPYIVKDDIKNGLYRSYISRCLRILTENTAKISGGKYIKDNFDDIINPKPKDSRTAEEIIAGIITQAGIEVI